MTRMIVIGVFGLLCLAVLVLWLMSSYGITIGDLRQFDEDPTSFTNSRPLNAIYEFRGDLALAGIIVVPFALGSLSILFFGSKRE